MGSSFWKLGERLHLFDRSLGVWIGRGQLLDHDLLRNSFNKKFLIVQIEKLLFWEAFNKRFLFRTSIQRCPQEHRVFALTVEVRRRTSSSDLLLLYCLKTKRVLNQWDISVTQTFFIVLKNAEIDDGGGPADLAVYTIQCCPNWPVGYLANTLLAQYRQVYWW